MNDKEHIDDIDYIVWSDEKQEEKPRCYKGGYFNCNKYYCEECEECRLNFASQWSHRLWRYHHWNPFTHRLRISPRHALDHVEKRNAVRLFFKNVQLRLRVLGRGSFDCIAFPHRSKRGMLHWDCIARLSECEFVIAILREEFYKVFGYHPHWLSIRPLDEYSIAYACKFKCGTMGRVVKERRMVLRSGSVEGNGLKVNIVSPIHNSISNSPESIDNVKELVPDEVQLVTKSQAGIHYHMTLQHPQRTEQDNSDPYRLGLLSYRFLPMCLPP